MSFRDTFTRDEQSDSNFDDFAFLYFAGAVLSAFGVIATYRLAQRILDPSGDRWPRKSAKGSRTLLYPETSVFRAKVARESLTSAEYIRSRSGMFRIGLVSLLWLLVAGIASALNDDASADIKSFDPFKILDVTTSSTEGEIKKAYRRKSLQYHPDKNPNDPLAAANFIQVAKAYAALTDEVARKNYEKYGNPDGPQTMKVGIGLPRIFLVKENQVLFLSIFFLVILGVVPLIFILYYQKQKLYEANGVMVETLRFLSYYLTENTRTRQAVDLLACSAEARLMPVRATDEAALKPLLAALPEDHRKAVLAGSKPGALAAASIVKSRALLLGHLSRLHAVMTPELKADLDELLRQSMKIVQAMVEIALVRDWPNTAMAMVEFMRSLVQAIDVSVGRDSPLLQVPHMDKQLVEIAAKGKAGNLTGNIRQWLAQPAAERRGTAEMTPAQLADVDAFARFFGRAKISARAHVENEAVFTAGDIVSIDVTVERQNIANPATEANGPVHAPLFPEAKFEEFWVFVFEDAANAHCIVHDKIRQAAQDAFGKVELKFRLGPNPRPMKLAVVVMSDSYLGVDERILVQFNVEKAVVQEVFIHPEDADLDKHPTLFQQMMGAQLVDDEEEEVDSDDEQGATPNNKKPPAAAAKHEDDDEDDDLD